MAAHDDNAPRTIPPERSSRITPPTPVVPITFGPPDGAPRQERSDAAENRRRIIEVAEALFTERGVDAVNMQEIAKAAGVGQGTLYRRFANKGELCLALMDTQMADFQNSVLARLRQMALSGATRREQLRWFLDALVRFNERHAPLLCAAQREAPIGAVGAVLPTSSPFAWMRMTVIGLLQAGVAAREFAADLDVPMLSDALLGVLHPPVFQAMRRSEAAYTLERISAGVNRLVDGLRAR